MKNQKGITLIALVITIIVLLILAGVTIATLTGENGILTQADAAKDNTNRAEAIEKINLALNAAYKLESDGTLKISYYNTETEVGTQSQPIYGRIDLTAAPYEIKELAK